MTNYEHYKDKIHLYSICAQQWGIFEGEISQCCSVCNTCNFNVHNRSESFATCFDAKVAWLAEEYKESEVDWSKVPIDAKILVSDDGKNWFKRHFAGSHPINKKIMAWVGGCTSWASENCNSWNYAKLAEEE